MMLRGVCAVSTVALNAMGFLSAAQTFSQPSQSLCRRDATAATPCPTLHTHGVGSGVGRLYRITTLPPANNLLNERIWSQTALTNRLQRDKDALEAKLEEQAAMLARTSEHLKVTCVLGFSDPRWKHVGSVLRMRYHMSCHAMPTRHTYMQLLYCSSWRYLAYKCVCLVQ